MTVIWVAITAITVGGLLVTVLSFIPKSEQQCAHCLAQCKKQIQSKADREYDTCVLNKSHKGSHSTAEGLRFK